MSLNYFESEIRNELAKLSNASKDFFWFRLFDTKTMRSVSEKIYAIKNPCDFVAISKGLIYLLELKSTKNPNSFEFRFIRDHQLESLVRAEESGNFVISAHSRFVRIQTVRSYFLICNRSKRLNYITYAIRAKDLKDLIIKSERKSIKWDNLSERSIRIRRVKGGWDLKELFGLKYIKHIKDY